LSQNVFITLVGYCFQYDYAVQRHSTSRRRLWSRDLWTLRIRCVRTAPRTTGQCVGRLSVSAVDQSTTEWRCNGTLIPDCIGSVNR